jgi:ABC-type Zn2+ transport system substrate-binding protein/surface adhesin
MATETTAKENTPRRDAEKHQMSQLVVVELARRRSPEQVKRLRKGRGKLVIDIEDALEELVKSGTINTDAQPVVIVVREGSAPLLWALDQDDDDEDEDDHDDDDDEDEDDR